MPISLVRCSGQPRAQPQRRASAAQSPAVRWWGLHTAGQSEPVPRLCCITAAADGFSASPTSRTWILPPLLRVAQRLSVQSWSHQCGRVISSDIRTCFTCASFAALFPLRGSFHSRCVGSSSPTRPSASPRKEACLSQPCTVLA